MERKKVHDIVVKELLNNKEEFKDFIREFLKYPIGKEDVEQFNREYRTSIGLETKYIDLLYKIIGEETYLLLEHQSKLDYEMPERIGEYCMAVVKGIEGNYSKNKRKVVPLIYPCVLNTSKRKWNVPRTIKHTGKNRFRFPNQSYPKYDVLDINDYTEDELLEKRTGMGLVMACEKIRTMEEAGYIAKKMEEHGEINEREKATIKLVVENMEIFSGFTPEEREEIKKRLLEIIEEGGNVMSNLEEFLRKVIRENAEKGRAEGRSQGILQVAKEMVKSKVSDEDIIKYTHLSKKELQELKLQMA